MKTEFEVRKLEVSFEEMIERMHFIGAKKVGVFHQRRFVYDFNPPEKGRWIRLRSNGKETTLTIKEIKSKRIDGTKELEIIVSDFEATNEILTKLGYVPRTYQENFRVEYTLEGVNFDLDKWPMIPSYIEIEGENEDDVYLMLRKINIDEHDVTTMDIDTLYREKYGIELDSIQNLCFNEDEKRFINEFV